MRTLYRIAINITAFSLRFAARFSLKLQQALRGRRGLWRVIEEHYKTVDPSRKRVIIHVASFGELEQAKPIIKQLKAGHPKVHIHLTFFSPSGYENTIGKYPDPDLITYLPFDTQKNVRCFLDLTKPDLFIFVRYDVWHTLAGELHARNIKTLLVSATLDDRKVKNPFIRSLYRKTYQGLNSILTTREADKRAILNLGVDSSKIGIAGDTRFDQVSERKREIEERGEQLLKPSLGDKLVLVAGSTWGKDEELLCSIDRSKIQLILVPHEVNIDHINSLQKLFPDSVLLSEIDTFHSESIIIVDVIGKLFSLYRYADIAYVGGGFGAGVHNVLEAAVWGKPVIVGPKIERSHEISELMKAGGVFVVKNEKQLQDTIKALSDVSTREKVAVAARTFVESRIGATNKIIEAITSVL